MAELSPAPDPLAPTGKNVPVPTPRPPQPSDAGGDAGADPSQTDPSQQTEKVTVTADAPAKFSRGQVVAAARDMEDDEALNAKTDALKPPPYSPPSPPKPRSTNPLEVWGSFAMLAAAVGSAFTRAPLTTMLNSAAGVMNAYKKGDEQEAQLQYEQWKQARTEYDSHYKMQQEAYRDALTDRYHTNMEKASRLRALATAFHDQEMEGIAAHTAASQDTARASAALDRRARLNAYMEINGDKIEKHKLNMEALKALHETDDYKKADAQQRHMMDFAAMDGNVIPQNAIDFMAVAYMKTRRMPYGADKVTKQRVLADVGRLMAQQNLSPGQVLAQGSSFQSDQRALDNLAKLTAATEGFERTVLNNMKNVEKLIPKNASVDTSPWVEEWVKTGQIQTGDKNAPAWLTAVLTVGTEYAKVMQGATGAGGTTEGARAEAAKHISGYFTGDQLEGVFAVMRADMKGKMTELNATKRALLTEMTVGPFDNKEQVMKLHADGGLSDDQALDILQDQFGIEP